MVFKIKDEKEKNIQGYLKPETKEEQVLIKLIVEELPNIKFYNDKIKVIENKIFLSFSSMEELNNILDLMSNELKFKYNVVK